MSTPRSTLEIIRDRARRTPDAPALLHGERSLGYGQLLALTHGAVRLFHQQGIRPGDSVGLSMDQTPLHCVALLGLLRLGALIVPMSPALPAAARERLAQKYGLRRMVADQETCRIAGLPFLHFTAVNADSDAADPLPEVQPDPGSPARLALTSGTTGEPKAVLHSQAELLERALLTTEGWDGHTRLLPPRLHLTAASASLLGTLCRGGVAVFPWGFGFDPLIAAVQRHQVSHLVLSPAAALALAARLPPDGLPGLKQLRLIGGAVAPAQLEFLRRHCTPHIHLSYALTELGLVCLATPQILEQDPGSAGRLLPWARLQVVDEHGAVLPPGHSGEIRVIGRPMPGGYYHDEAQTRLRFRDGWFHTGDLGSLSAEGLLRIEGRNDELLNFGGHKLLPAVLEDRLLLHAPVRQAAVFAVAGIAGSQHIAAALVMAPGYDPAALAAHCRQLGFSGPGSVLLLEELPRNELGKVLRGELRRIAAAHRP